MAGSSTVGVAVECRACVSFAARTVAVVGRNLFRFADYRADEADSDARDATRRVEDAVTKTTIGSSRAVFFFFIRNLVSCAGGTRDASTMNEDITHMSFSNSENRLKK